MILWQRRRCFKKYTRKGVKYMIEKEVAIDILEDIQNSLTQTNWKEESLKTIAIYRKWLEIATSPKIKNLVEKYKEYKENYGENDKKTLKIAKKIDDETHKIYNN